MIVLPNSFERYLSSLRIFVSLSILKHGLQGHHLEKLKKIYIAEALLNKNTKQSLNICKLCANFFGVLSITKHNPCFSVNATKNRLINKQLFTLLLLNVASASDYCKIETKENFILIKTENSNPFPISLLKLLGGFYLSETKTNLLLLIIPSDITSEPSVYIESEWELLFDKFSVFNIFFGNVTSE